MEVASGRSKYIGTAVVVNKDGELTSGASTEIWSITDAEELAVALAAAKGYRENKSLNILTDSKETCRNYTKGRISKAALKVLRECNLSESITVQHNLIWIPAHEGIRGNEAADGLARAFCFRVGQQQESRGLSAMILGDSYSELLQHHRGVRYKYPPPHKALTKEEATDWRRLQTGSFPNLFIYNKMFPTQYRGTCPWCGATPTLFHITWECERNNAFREHKPPSAEHWESRLVSCELAVQKRMVEHARDAAKLSGALD